MYMPHPKGSIIGSVHWIYCHFQGIGLGRPLLCDLVHYYAGSRHYNVYYVAIYYKLCGQKVMHMVSSNTQVRWVVHMIPGLYEGGSMCASNAFPTILA